LCEKEDAQSCDEGEECWKDTGLKEGSIKNSSENHNADIYAKRRGGCAELIGVPVTASWQRIVAFRVPVELTSKSMALSTV
jgi:hypothetical protein